MPSNNSPLRDTATLLNQLFAPCQGMRPGSSVHRLPTVRMRSSITGVRTANMREPNMQGYRSPPISLVRNVSRTPKPSWVDRGGLCQTPLFPAMLASVGDLPIQ